MHPAAKTKPAGTALTMELNFLVATDVVSGNGCCEGLDHPARDCKACITLWRFLTHELTSGFPGVHRDAYR